MIASWMYTVNNQLGIFHVDTNQSNPLLVDSDGEKSINEPTGGESLQDVWLQFLAKRYKAVRYYSKEQVSTIST